MSRENFAILAENSLHDLLQKLELNAALEDLDIDIIDGVIHLEFEDGAQIVINSQSSAQQLWLATPYGPHHFSYDETRQCWCDDRDGSAIEAALANALSKKLGRPVLLD